MKLLLIAPAGLKVQGAQRKARSSFELGRHRGLATPYFDEIKIVEEAFERLDPNETADPSVSP